MRIGRLSFGKAFGFGSWGWGRYSCRCFFIDLGIYYIMFADKTCKCAACEKYDCECVCVLCEAKYVDCKCEVFE